MRGSPRQVQEWARKLLALHQFPGATLQGLVSIIGSCEIRAYKSNEVILTENTAGKEMYILLDGSVSVFKLNAQGQDQHLVDMTQATVFGHMSLADRSLRSATCLAIGDVTLACMPQSTYNDLMTSPAIGTMFRRLMLTTLTRQLVMGSAKLTSLLAPKQPHEKRKSTQELGHDLELLGELDDITQEDILDLAGVTMGWKVSTRGVDNIQLVVTEDDLRRGFKPVK